MEMRIDRGTKIVRWSPYDSSIAKIIRADDYDLVICYLFSSMLIRMPRD